MFNKTTKKVVVYLAVFLSLSGCMRIREVVLPTSATTTLKTFNWRSFFPKAPRVNSYTATPLSDGRILYVGGTYSIVGIELYATNIEIYNPTDQTWSTLNSTFKVAEHTATLLNDGRVLISGGHDEMGTEVDSIIINPNASSGSEITLIANSSTHRNGASATLMDNGKVLITGGNEATQASDIYDPINNTWSTTSDSSIVHYYCHTSAKLFDGRVLITSGADSNGQFNTASQIYDPSDDSWQTIAQQAGICWSQIIPLNDSSDRLLIAGGWDPWTGDPITTWFYFDPHTNTFSAVKPLPANFEIFHSSALKDGSALLSGSDFYRFNPMNVNGEWSQVPFQPLMNEIRLGRAPLTLLPNGKVLMLVGVGELVGIEAQATRAFTFDPNETPGNEFKDLTTDPSIFGRIGGANTVLPDGKIFTVGGFRQSTDAIALGISGGADYSQVLDLENTTSIPWTKTATPTMISTHNAFISKTITLTNGKVLAIGDASSELYDPTSDTWSSYASHSPSISSDLFLGSGVTATLLKNGNVLVVGGTQSKIYNATSGTWTASGTLNVSRSGHSATLLENGEVLVASETTSELYDPVAGTWTNTTGNLTTNRSGHSATLMKNGKVMVISDNSAEIFDPSLGTWSSAGTLSIARPNHTATLLPNGKLIVVGGGQGNTGTYLATSEIYDPTTGTWSMNSHELVDGRSLHFATITKDGRLAIVGGFGIFGVLPFVEYLEY